MRSFDDDHYMLIQTFKNLSTLGINCVNEGKPYIDDPDGFDRLVTGKSLKELLFSHCSKLRDDSMIIVALNSKNLVILNLYNCDQITDVSIK